jgi:hypothetical protein
MTYKKCDAMFDEAKGLRRRLRRRSTLGPRAKPQHRPPSLSSRPSALSLGQQQAHSRSARGGVAGGRARASTRGGGGGRSSTGGQSGKRNSRHRASVRESGSFRGSQDDRQDKLGESVAWNGGLVRKWRSSTLSYSLAEVHHRPAAVLSNVAALSGSGSSSSSSIGDGGGGGGGSGGGGSGGGISGGGISGGGISGGGISGGGISGVGGGGGGSGGGSGLTNGDRDDCEEEGLDFGQFLWVMDRARHRGRSNAFSSLVDKVTAGFTSRSFSLNSPPRPEFHRLLTNAHTLKTFHPDC